MIFSKKQLAIDAAERYADKNQDDVYVVRNGRGNEWALVTRPEMLEFKSCYIEHYHRYSPKEKYLAAFMKLIRDNNLIGSSVSYDAGKIILKTEEKQYQIQIIEAHENNDL